MSHATVPVTTSTNFYKYSQLSERVIYIPEGSLSETAAVVVVSPGGFYITLQTVVVVYLGEFYIISGKK